MNLAQEIGQLIGASRVSEAPDMILAHSGDKWYATHSPDVVVFPETTEEVSTVVRWANQHGIPITARGAGVGYVGGCVPIRGGISLSLMNMNRILEINPADGVAIVESGVITADLQEKVAALGWFYPPDPASRKECSLGGNIATNAGGPRCLKYGVTKSYVLGLTVVLANGEIVHCGGRTHKNKSGFDLTSLFVGSEGMLGIITEAILRIIPHPQSRGAISASFDQFSTAALAVQTILQAGHLPSALEITDAFTLQAARNYLNNDLIPHEAQGHLIVEVDGLATSVRDEIKSISQILTQLGATKIQLALNETDTEAIWALRREFSYSLKATGMTKLNEDIVIPRSQLVALVEFCQGLQQQYHTSIACFGHSGDGNIHTNIMVNDYSQPDQKANADACVEALFAWVLEHHGSITGEHGIGLAKAKWFSDSIGAPALELHKTLRQALDPNHILNPGKMGL